MPNRPPASLLPTDHARAAARSRSGESPAGFAIALREHTHDVHREAERGGFLATLIRGRASREGYALFLRNLLPVYEALEDGLEAVRARGADALSRPFVDPDLHRGDALRADLPALAGAAWASRLPVLPEARAYADAVAEAAAQAVTGAAGRLVAHAYARLLGDLSGGQILRPILARTLGHDALAFCDFPALADLAVPKAAMRDALDTLDPAGPLATAVAAEAVSAFRHNIAVTAAVARAVG